MNEPLKIVTRMLHNNLLNSRRMVYLMPINMQGTNPLNILFSWIEEFLFKFWTNCPPQNLDSFRGAMAQVDYRNGSSRTVYLIPICIQAFAANLNGLPLGGLLYVQSIFPVGVTTKFVQHAAGHTFYIRYFHNGFLKIEKNILTK